MMHITTKFIAGLALSFVWFFIWPAGVTADELPEPPLKDVAMTALAARIETRATLPDLLAYAYETNPSVTASRKSWQAFIENYRIGTTYADPRLAATFFPEPIETRLGPQDWNLTLSQAIPFPGTLTQKGKVLAADVAISRLKTDKTVKMLVRDLSTAVYELGYVQQAITVAKANLALSRSLVEMGQKGYALDQSQLYDVSKARAQTAQILYDIHLLEELAATERARINTLLNREPDAPLGQIVAPELRQAVYSLTEIYRLCTAHQEDIRMADVKFDQATEAVRLTTFETLPSFNLGLFYAGIGQPDVANPPSDAGDDALGVQLGLNLPLWFGKNKSRKARALALKEQARADRDATANRIKAEISRLWFKLENARRLAALYENEMLPQALDQARTAQTWVEQDQGRLSDFLEIQATAYNFQLSLARARADYGQTLVKLEQLAGVVLDRRAETPGKEGLK